MAELIRSEQYGSYEELFDKFRSLAKDYGNLPIDMITGAYERSGMGMQNNPYIQNDRVKRIPTLPLDYSKEAIVEMILSPTNNEIPLRNVMHALEYSAYPLFKIRKTYQDILSYHWYVSPAYVDGDEAKTKEFMREWAMADKLAKAFKPSEVMHRACGQAVEEGKVFYASRYSIDKSHAKVNYAFMQQLPSDWVKIIGYNNVSKYTVSFNMMYFITPGADFRQFGDLFKPYIDDFRTIFEEDENPDPKKYVYASRNAINAGDRTLHVNWEKFRKLKERGAEGNPDLYSQNGRWAYWVSLPIDRVWTFEIDDTNPTVVSPLTGLFLAMSDIAKYEQVQLAIVQNPLVALFTGELEFVDSPSLTASDKTKLSPSGRALFQHYWEELMMSTNTGGIGLYSAPFKNIQMHQLSEAPNATKISATGYAYAVEKSGLSALIPITDDPRAGLAAISAQIEARYCESIYRAFENMMNRIFSELGFKYEWRFTAFGDIFSDEDALKSAKEGATLGILSETFRYNALLGRSTLDDIAMSKAIDATGLLDLRKPLITSYTAKNPDSSLPPTGDKGGRPTNEETGKEIDTEGAEDALDNT